MRFVVRYFTNKSLRFKLMVIILAPLLGMIYFSALELQNKLTLSNNMAQIKPITALAVYAGNAVHELQKERGLSAGYLGSGGRSFAQELRQQRRITDRAAIELSGAANSTDILMSQRLRQLIGSAQKEISRLSEMRKRVDQQQIKVAEQVAFYSQINQILLEIPATIPHISKESVISLEASAYLNLLQAKERAGIERAVLANTFANDAFTGGNFEKLIALIAAQKSYLTVFKSFANEEQLSHFKTMMNSPAIQEVEQLRRIAINSAASGNFGVDAKHWFSTISKKINLLKTLEEALANDLQLQTDTRLAQAQQQFYTVLAIAIVILLAVLLLAGLICRIVSQQISTLHDAISTIEKSSDLSIRAVIDSECEVGKTAVAFNKMTSKFKGILHNISEVAAELSSETQRVSAFTEQSTQGIAKQRQETDLVATAINEMSSAVQQVAENTREAADATEKAEQEAVSSKQVVNDVISSIHHQANDVEESVKIIQTLKLDSDNIGSVLEVIQSIAEQTNLLALNAAIEAARAGEQGRGFAVVADEVRSLASRTQESTREIQQVIERLQSGAERAVNSMKSTQERSYNSVNKAEQAGESLQQILDAIMKISSMTTEIAGAVSEQTIVAEEINQNIQGITQVSDEAYQGAQETQSASEQMALMAENLNQIVQQFKLK